MPGKININNGDKLFLFTMLAAKKQKGTTKTIRKKNDNKKYETNKLFDSTHFKIELPDEEIPK